MKFQMMTRPKTNKDHKITEIQQISHSDILNSHVGKINKEKIQNLC